MPWTDSAGARSAAPDDRGDSMHATPTAVHPPLYPDPGEIHAFLRALLAGRTAGVTLVAIAPSCRTAPRFVDMAGVSAACHWVYEKNRAGWNLYWTPAETAQPVHKKPRKEDVARVSWLWVDVDPSATTADELAIERAAIEDRLRAADPDLLIDSGRGMWAFWRLLSALEGESGLARAEQVNRALAAALGGDASAWNVDRLARLPGTVNWPNKLKVAKGAQPRLARCLVASWERWQLVEVIVRGIPGAAAALAREEEKPASGLRPSAGPTVKGARASMASAALPAVSLDYFLERFPRGAVGIVLELRASRGRSYPSRSEAAFGFARSCGRAFHLGARHLSRELVAAVLLQPELTFELAQHFLEQPDPMRAARRTVGRAFESAERALAQWHARRRGGRGA